MIEVNKNLENGVSVVIPFYNRSKFLKRLLDSIAIQTLAPEKIFIVDNGSSLEEADIAWDIIQAHELLASCCFLSTINRGNANFARNLGYDLSETKYVAFLDSDDWWEKEHLTKSIESLEYSGKAAVYSGAIIHSNNSTNFSNTVDIDNFNDPFSLVLNGYFAQTSSYVLNKDLIKNIVVWDTALNRHQDFDYFASIFYKTEGWSYTSKFSTNIDWQEGGATPQQSHLTSLIDFYKKWQHKMPDKIKKIYLFKMLYYVYRTNSNNNIKEFYRSELKRNGLIINTKDKIYISHSYINFHLNVIRSLDKLGLKDFVKKILEIKV